MGRAPRKSDLGGGETFPGLTSFLFWQSQKKRGKYSSNASISPTLVIVEQGYWKALLVNSRDVQGVFDVNLPQQAANAR
jgi:hypothetical protein